jgi:hypothetical protein
MPALHRRHFLQFAGTTLATLGLSHWDIQRQGDRYAKVLAQGTPRKLALLIGINTYPESSQYSNLQGCLTDVELQRQLLIHRFGFNPNDIVTLTEQQATRQAILTTFEEHLIKQVKTGDVVVVHYSGHGSQVMDPDRDNPDGLNGTFVPADSGLPAGFPNSGGVVKDIMGHTLFLLMRALPTESVTAVLDSCHSGGAKRDYLRVRSRAGGAQLQASPAEFEYQRQWLARLNLSPEAFIRQRRAGVANGVVIASAKRNQLAADAPFSDFYAGAFTYLMTQYLWQQTGRAIVNNTIPNIARSTTKASSSGQEPEFEVKPGSNYANQMIYFVPQQPVPAEAVITRVEGDRADVWLGGLAPQSLAAFGKEAILAAVDGSGNLRGQVKLESRDGLFGRGKLLNAAQPGALLQEQVRGIPTTVGLKIGLASSLGSETAQANQALQAIRRIEPVLPQQGEVQYILGRITTAEQATIAAVNPATPLPPIGSLGLFYPTLQFVPNSFGAAGEAIDQAVQRLQPKLKALLAARLVKLTLNPNSSRLNLQASMSAKSTAQSQAAQLFEVRSGQRDRGAAATVTRSLAPTRLPLGTPVQFSIQNNESRDLYVNVFVIDAAGDMTVIFPNQWTASAEVMRIAAGRSLQLPDQSDNFSFVTQEPKGTTEVLIIASATPLGNSLKALQQLAVRGGVSRGPVGVGDPVAAIAGLLSDLEAGTRSSRGTMASTAEVQRVDTSQLAALSITFEVI